jgi:hypothetical protein
MQKVGNSKVFLRSERAVFTHENTEQKKLDCLDYLIFNMKKEKE